MKKRKSEKSPDILARFDVEYSTMHLAKDCLDWMRHVAFRFPSAGQNSGCIAGIVDTTYIIRVEQASAFVAISLDSLCK